MITIGEIYKQAINLGIKADPRGEKEVKEELKKRKEQYKELKSEQKEEYDKERLTNPYDDTRILYGDPKTKVNRVLVGIDMEIGEILLADRLNEKGKKIDLIISHHPEGYALANFYKVMGMQADILNKYGIPINIAEALLKERISEVERNIMPANHNRSTDAARMLNIPYLCIHTPADNMVANYLQKKMDELKPRYLKDIIKFLKQIPEYKQASTENSGPKILVGNENNRSGKVFVDMTGGTEGPQQMVKKLADAGVGTVICMHYKDVLRKEAEKNHINVIIAGHIASDTFGLNLLLDELLKIGDFEILCCSGFRRFSRN